MDPITIASLVAMIAGAGMQYKATSDAAKRAQEEALRASQRHDEYQRQAEQKAMNQAQEFNTDNRAAEQARIEQQLTQEYIAPAKSATEINSSATTTQGAVSDDYMAARARSQAEIMKNAETLARLFGKTGAAHKLRTNEAIRMADTAAGIDRLGNFSRRMGEVDEFAVKAAGTPNAGLMIGGQLAMGLGTLGLANGAGSTGVTSEAGELGSGMYSTPTPSGIGAAPSAPKPTNLGTGFWGAENNTAFKPLPKSFDWTKDVNNWTSGYRTFDWPVVGG
ncbi:hypothetical protein [Noviherbaspirillum aridicola]|uniref:Uncharacterized protein n=1 Tax=Noviherbaspirillum aridicola TaxID=2849687 RepID=A0ABQ4QA19_9BURK|nr:hypothetical protein [Noviherbaspirillum aridicola]GIZ54053.1 hypothetical protein NCCP691_40670 [Noviherbaspirillum aridicola]